MVEIFGVQENATENFDHRVDDQTDLAIYGHVHKQLLR